MALPRILTHSLILIPLNLLVKIPLEEVKRVWERTSAPYHVRRIGHHYGIFRDLFDSADFAPQVTLQVDYDLNEDETAPVYTGNFVTPTEVAVTLWHDNESNDADRSKFTNIYSL